MTYLHIFNSGQCTIDQILFLRAFHRGRRAPGVILIDGAKHIAKNQSMSIWATTLRGECNVEANVPVYWIYILKSYLILQKCIFWKACITPWKVQSVLKKQKFIHQLTRVYSMCTLSTKNKNISMAQPVLRNWPQSDEGGDCGVR